MANPIAIRKLTKELKNLETEPVPGITFKTNQSNILVWFFTFEGPEKTAYEGGVYFGKIIFPTNYPFAPPDIMMITPNGRFSVGHKICTTMTGFHSDQWSPSWSLSQYLIGFISIMTDDKEHGIGHIKDSDEVRKKLAKDSIKYNQNIPEYLEHFT